MIAWQRGWKAVVTPSGPHLPASRAAMCLEEAAQSWAFQPEQASHQHLHHQEASFSQH